MTEIVYGALLGTLIGGLWAVAELVLLTRVIKRADAKAAAMLAAGADKQAASRKTTEPVLKFFVSKYFLNVALLVVVFLLRGFLPWRWEFILLFVGIGLTVLFQLLLMVSGLSKRINGGTNYLNNLNGKSY